MGLDTVYIQAKKWKEGTVVGRPEIQKFVGAIKGRGANKGIFITTSSFSKGAEDYASRINSPKIVLIDGTKLAELMIEYDIGISKINRFDACIDARAILFRKIQSTFGENGYIIEPK